VNVTQSHYVIDTLVNITLNCTADLNRRYVSLGSVAYVFTWKLGSDTVKTEQNINGYSVFSFLWPGLLLVQTYTCSVYLREQFGRLGQSTATDYVRTIGNPGMVNWFISN